MHSHAIELTRCHTPHAGFLRIKPTISNDLSQIQAMACFNRKQAWEGHVYFEHRQDCRYQAAIGREGDICAAAQLTKTWPAGRT